MAHPALRNADIVSIICESLHKQSLARAATFLQYPALRELWRDIKALSHLLLPLGPSTHQNIIHFPNPPTSTQWDRFRFYAQFVRNFCISYNDRIEPPSAWMLLQHRPLLPHLKSLTVSLRWPGQATTAFSMFFVASIQKFTVHSCQNFITLGSLMTELGTTAPALRDLKIEEGLLCEGPWDFGIYVSKFHNLGSIDIPLTDLHVHSVLSHLSTLPSLSRIRFDMVFSAKVFTSGPKYSFSAVTDLKIDSKSDDAIMHLMELTRFDNLAKIAIRCNNYQMEDGLLFMAFPVSCGQALNQITITGYSGDTDEPMNFSTIFPLLEFPNIRSFSFSVNQPVWPTDRDIRSIVTSWTKLEEFCVNPDLAVGEHHTYSLTLTGLLLLIEKCTSLMKISIAVTAYIFEIPAVTSSISRPGLAIEIQPLSSLINDPEAFADFFNIAFPDADFTIGDYGGAKPFDDYYLWEEVKIVRENFTKGLHAVKQIEEHQMAWDKYRKNAPLSALHKALRTICRNFDE